MGVPAKTRRRYGLYGLVCLAWALWMGSDGLDAMRTGAVVRLETGYWVPGWMILCLAALLAFIALCMIAVWLGLMRPRGEGTELNQ